LDTQRIETLATAEAAVDRVSLTFEAFFEREYAPLVRLAYLLSGDRAEAEEIAQEAMARVYERWGHGVPRRIRESGRGQLLPPATPVASTIPTRRRRPAGS
jgi:hypothetical protein